MYFYKFIRLFVFLKFGEILKKTLGKKIVNLSPYSEHFAFEAACAYQTFLIATFENLLHKHASLEKYSNFNF